MNDSAVSVADIMSTELTTASPDLTLKALLDIFNTHTFHHLPVVENRSLVGIVSDRDLSLALSPNIGTDHESDGDRQLLDQCAADIMTNEVVTVDRCTSLDTASIMLLEHDFSCLPVLNSDGSLAGLITWKDLLKYFVYAGV